MEIIFETIETEDIYMNLYHSMIKPIVNNNLGNKFQHQNGPNQRHAPTKIPVSSTNTAKLYNSAIT